MHLNIFRLQRSFFGLLVDISISIDLKNQWAKIVLFVTSFLLCESFVCFTAVTLMKLILFDDFPFPERLIYKSFTAVAFLYTISNSINHVIIIYNSFHKVQLAGQGRANAFVLLNTFSSSNLLVVSYFYLLFTVYSCPDRNETTGRLAPLECVKICFMY